MKILVKEGLDKTTEYIIDGDTATVGRGQSCDIVVDNDHISRKHLIVERVEHTIFIKDITLANWVSYNNEKMIKDAPVEYFDFAPLMLPGNLEVKITLDEENSSNNIEDNKIDILKNKYNSTSSMTDLKVPRESEAKLSLKQKRKEKNHKQELVLMGFFFLLVLLFLYLQFFKTSKNKSINIAQPAKVKTVVKSEMKVVSDQPQKAKEIDPRVIMISNYQKCDGRDNLKTCDYIFGSRSTFEGILYKKNKLVVMQNVLMQKNRVAKEIVSQLITRFGRKTTAKYLSSYKLFAPNFLKSLERNKIYFIEIIVFKQIAKKFVILKEYKIDVTDYRKFDEQIYSRAYRSENPKDVLNTFEEYFSRLIKER